MPKNTLIESKLNKYLEETVQILFFFSVLCLKELQRQRNSLYNACFKLQKPLRDFISVCIFNLCLKNH